MQIGDRVAYSRKFLQAIACYTGYLPFARGYITAIEPLGEITLATVVWDDPRVPQKINVKNLVRVTKERGVEELP